MKFNRTPIIVALVFLIINALFFLHATTLNGGGSMIYIFIFPAFWIITFITIVIISIKNSKTWFQKKYLLSTIIALFFCTPVSVLLIVLLVRPSSYLASSGGYGPNDGHAHTFETWDYYSGKRAAKKYWTDSRRDSTWVYFNKKGDTTSTETYRNDTLIRKKTY